MNVLTYIYRWFASWKNRSQRTHIKRYIAPRSQCKSRLDGEVVKCPSCGHENVVGSGFPRKMLPCESCNVTIEIENITEPDLDEMLGKLV